MKSQHQFSVLGAFTQVQRNEFVANAERDCGRKCKGYVRRGKFGLVFAVMAVTP